MGDDVESTFVPFPDGRRDVAYGIPLGDSSAPKKTSWISEK